VKSRERRRLLAAGAAAGATFGWWSGVLAQSVNPVPTPTQVLGPFYPPAWPSDAQGDLTRVAGGTARGEITFLSGAVFDLAGRRLTNARVEIWQCNAEGRYHHPRDTADRPLDPNFRGFGAVMTDAAGMYSFKTIRPVSYPGRPPHIHFRVVGPNVPGFVTQMYVAGDPSNARDPLLSSINDARARASLLAPFQRIAGTNEWTVRFDLVIPTRA
jgi:protocatechuate 3,4-dioxygenase, beta subunit